MNSSWRWLNRIVATWLTATAIIFTLTINQSTSYPYHILANTTVAAVLIAANHNKLPKPLDHAYKLYPLLLFLLLYMQVDELVIILYSRTSLDPLFTAIETTVFNGHPSQYLSQLLSHQLWSELFHLFYLSYYILLIAPYTWLWHHQSEQLPRYAFVLTGTFLSFLLAFILLPVSGPLGTGDTTLSTEGIFPSITTTIYQPSLANGVQTGAFPSSHVGIAVCIALLLSPKKWHSKTLLRTTVLGISIATVYTGVHYGIDPIAGLLTGAGLYYSWDKLHSRLK